MSSFISLSLSFDRRPCAGVVECVILHNGDVITAGQDGVIRVWDLDTLDGADSAADGGPCEVEPMNERRLGSDVHIKVCRYHPICDDFFLEL